MTWIFLGVREKQVVFANWLCPEPGDRLRLIDMSARVRGARLAQGSIMSAVALAAAPWVGWWILPLFFVVAGMLALLERRLPDSPHPELHVIAALGVFAVVIALIVLGSGGLRSPFAGWFLVPLIMLAARFRPRVVYTGLAATAALATAAFLGAAQLRAPERLPDPLAYAAWAALVLGVVAAAMALLGAELSSRGQAAVDPLTGLFNRSALVARSGQAVEQAAVVGGWLSVVMLDIDHFKEINDTFGHGVGDAVLRGIAEQIRTMPRLADVVFRYGGEEFLVLLPGYSPQAAHRVAQELRASVGGETYDDVAVTLSAGIASAEGADVKFDELLRSADSALYAAKNAGRDRTCVSA